MAREKATITMDRGKVVVARDLLCVTATSEAIDLAFDRTGRAHPATMTALCGALAIAVDCRDSGRPYCSTSMLVFGPVNHFLTDRCQYAHSRIMAVGTTRIV